MYIILFVCLFVCLFFFKYVQTFHILLSTYLLSFHFSPQNIWKNYFLIRLIQIWPTQFREDIGSLNSIDKHHVEQMLEPVTYPEHFPELPKQHAMKKVASHLADIEDLQVDRILKK